jgi:hypothetical protein
MIKIMKGVILLVSENFYFDGISNEDKGIYLIRTDNMIKIPFIPNKDIREDFPTWSDTPYFYGIKNQQYSISMLFSTLDDNLTSAKFQEIANWLFQDSYKEFYSEDNTEKRFYLIATGQIDIQQNIINEGYFEVTFQSFYPYALTSSATPTYNITSGDTIVINNPSNVYEYYKPELEFVVGTGISTVSFKNTSDDDRTMTFSNLDAGETIYVDCRKKRIISSGTEYRYDDFNKIWMRLIQGDNSIQVTGDITLTLRTQFPMFT